VGFSVNDFGLESTLDPDRLFETFSSPRLSFGTVLGLAISKEFSEAEVVKMGSAKCPR